MSFLALRTFAKPAGSVSNDKRFKKKFLDLAKISAPIFGEISGVGQIFEKWPQKGRDSLLLFEGPNGQTSKGWKMPKFRFYDLKFLSGN